MFGLDPTRIDSRAPLAQGSFGKIYAYRSEKKDTKDWVIKSIHAKDTRELKYFMQEVVLSFNHKHPCIVSNRGYDIQDVPAPPKDSQSGAQDSKSGGWNIYIKMPKIEMSIRNLIGKHAKEKSREPLNDVVKYFYNAASGLEYLESKRIIHNNINPGTIMIDKDHVARVGGIGLAQHKPWKTDEPGIGTALYTAPERLKKKFVLEKETAFKGDVWSLGLTILELCLLKLKRYEPQDDDGDWLLGEGKSKSQEESKISDEEKSKFGTVLVEENLEALTKEYGKKLGDLHDESAGIKQLVDILKDTLKANPKERISFSQICKRLEEAFPDFKMKEELSSFLNDRSRYEDECDESGSYFFYNDYSSPGDYDEESAHNLQPFGQSFQTANQSDQSLTQSFGLNVDSDQGLNY